MALDVTTSVVSHPSMHSVARLRASTRTLTSPVSVDPWSSARFAAARASKPGTVPVVYTVRVCTGGCVGARLGACSVVSCDSDSCSDSGSSSSDSGSSSSDSDSDAGSAGSDSAPGAGPWAAAA
eukprot:480158-Prymnesium_polylepis.2